MAGKWDDKSCWDTTWWRVYCAWCYTLMWLWGQTRLQFQKQGRMATNRAYLAEAKICSYLGDHRTDRTSPLWPGMENCLFIMPVCAWNYVSVEKHAGKCSLVHWPWRTWIFEPDFRSQSWILGFLVPTENAKTGQDKYRTSIISLFKIMFNRTFQLIIFIIFYMYLNVWAWKKDKVIQKGKNWKPRFLQIRCGKYENLLINVTHPAWILHMGGMQVYW